ncbi:hypothetical protein CBR_g74631 [Chara braunii]|uniref:TATA box binding protein associated factor (TAF) histone-like fold domain-containing protein n=1 Tax=Chara braunii TaxID=69332 RepID=A0A388KA40_CHABU|nr:hypothetical protein CBR_g74631 [Chara braunii]|eukprot:GBG66944.1 hypothetical protein CBR_g74631 [Chara braunii]
MSLLLKETIQGIGQSIGVNLADEVAAALAPDVEYRMREIIQEAIKWMRHSKRSALSCDDFSSALCVRNVEEAINHRQQQSLPRIPEKDAEEDKKMKPVGGDQDGGSDMKTVGSLIFGGGDKRGRARDKAHNLDDDVVLVVDHSKLTCNLLPVGGGQRTDILVAVTHSSAVVSKIEGGRGPFPAAKACPLARKALRQAPQPCRQAEELEDAVV